jgi:hypothetical protein
MLEWDLSNAQRSTSSGSAGIGCIRHLGLRSSLGNQLVPVEVGRPGERVGHCCQGAAPYYCCTCGMGRGRHIECHCDNMAVVAVVNSGRSRDKTLMHLLRCLFFVAAQKNVQVHACHLPGTLNVAADALSRDCILDFLQVVPEAEVAVAPTSIPQSLIDLTIREQPDWTSPRWAKLFSACCRQA